MTVSFSFSYYHPILVLDKQNNTTIYPGATKKLLGKGFCFLGQPLVICLLQRCH